MHVCITNTMVMSHLFTSFSIRLTFSTLIFCSKQFIFLLLNYLRLEDATSPDGLGKSLLSAAAAASLLALSFAAFFFFTSSRYSNHCLCNKTTSRRDLNITACHCDHKVSHPIMFYIQRIPNRQCPTY